MDVNSRTFTRKIKEDDVPIPHISQSSSLRPVKTPNAMQGVGNSVNDPIDMTDSGDEEATNIGPSLPIQPKEEEQKEDDSPTAIATRVFRENEKTFAPSLRKWKDHIVHGTTEALPTLLAELKTQLDKAPAVSAVFLEKYRLTHYLMATRAMFKEHDPRLDVLKALQKSIFKLYHKDLLQTPSGFEVIPEHPDLAQLVSQEFLTPKSSGNSFRTTETRVQQPKPSSPTTVAAHVTSTSNGDSHDTLESVGVIQGTPYLLSTDTTPAEAGDYNYLAFGQLWICDMSGVTGMKCFVCRHCRWTRGHPDARLMNGGFGHASKHLLDECTALPTKLKEQLRDWRETRKTPCISPKNSRRIRKLDFFESVWNKSTATIAISPKHHSPIKRKPTSATPKSSGKPFRTPEDKNGQREATTSSPTSVATKDLLSLANRNGHSTFGNKKKKASMNDAESGTNIKTTATKHKLLYFLVDMATIKGVPYVLSNDTNRQQLGHYNYLAAQQLWLCDESDGAGKLLVCRHCFRARSHANPGLLSKSFCHGASHLLNECPALPAAIKEDIESLAKNRIKRRAAGGISLLDFFTNVWGKPTAVVTRCAKKPAQCLNGNENSGKQGKRIPLGDYEKGAPKSKRRKSQPVARYSPSVDNSNLCVQSSGSTPRLFEPALSHVDAQFKISETQEKRDERTRTQVQAVQAVSQPHAGGLTNVQGQDAAAKKRIAELEKELLKRDAVIEFLEKREKQNRQS